MAEDTCPRCGAQGERQPVMGSSTMHHGGMYRVPIAWGPWECQRCDVRGDVLVREDSGDSTV